MTRARHHSQDDRLRLMRGIHGACRTLGLDEDARHDVQLSVTGKASMRDMGPRDLTRLLAHLNKLQGEARSGSAGPPSGGRRESRTGGAPDGKRGYERGHSAADGARGGKIYPRAKRGDVRLIHALWGELGRRGALKRPDRAGLNAFIRSRFGDHWACVPLDVDMLDHSKDRSNTARINDVIRALRAMLARAEAEAGQARETGDVS